MREDRLQYEIAQWLRSQNITFFHVPNGGTRNKAEAAQMVACGVKAGVHDLVLMLPGGICLFIELKTNSGIVSKPQKKFHYATKMLSHQQILIQTDSPQQAIAQIEKAVLRLISPDFSLPLASIDPLSELELQPEQ